MIEVISKKLQEILRFPSPAEDETTEETLMSQWKMTREQLHGIDVNELPRREQSCPIQYDIPSMVIDYKSEKADSVQQMCGYTRIVMRYVYKIHDVIAYCNSRKIPSINLPIRDDVSNIATVDKFVSTNQNLQNEKGMTLEDLIEAYCNDRISGKKWIKRSILVHKNRLKYLLDYFGNINIKEIGRNNWRDYRDTLQKLPRNWKTAKNYQGMSLHEVFEKAESDESKKLGVKTINILLDTASALFNFAVDEGYVEKNFATGLQIDDKRKAINLRPAFTDDEIKKIFTCKKYIGKKEKRPEYYWPPLISLYTGMRLEEICQLHCNDIDTSSNIPFIKIVEYDDGNEDNQKILKTKNADRTIPLHKSLVSHGLLDYVNKVKQAPKSSIRLFPMLKKTHKNKKFGKNVGKQFSRLIKPLGIEEGKSFHSLRHTFIQKCKEKDLLETVAFRQIAGHEGKSLAEKQYGNPLSPQQCYEKVISKLRFFDEDG
jgi:integrase